MRNHDVLLPCVQAWWFAFHPVRAARLRGRVGHYRNRPQKSAWVQQEQQQQQNILISEVHRLLYLIAAALRMPQFGAMDEVSLAKKQCRDHRTQIRTVGIHQDACSSSSSSNCSSYESCYNVETTKYTLPAAAAQHTASPPAAAGRAGCGSSGHTSKGHSSSIGGAGQDSSPCSTQCSSPCSTQCSKQEGLLQSPMAAAAQAASKVTGEAWRHGKRAAVYRTIFHLLLIALLLWSTQLKGMLL